MRTRLRRLPAAATFALVLAVVGLALAPTALAAGPTITSDKEDYAPGELATLTGAGWGVDEAVRIVVIGDGVTYADAVVVATDGTFSFPFAVPTTGVERFDVLATGGTGATATTSFTDSNLSYQFTRQPAAGFQSVPAGGSWSFAMGAKESTADANDPIVSDVAGGGFGIKLYDLTNEQQLKRCGAVPGTTTPLAAYVLPSAWLSITSPTLPFTVPDASRWYPFTVQVAPPSGAAAGKYSAAVNFEGTRTGNKFFDLCVEVTAPLVNPKIDVTKTGPMWQVAQELSPDYATNWEDVTYTYEVKNTGDVPLSSVGVSDDECGTATYKSGDTNGNSKLDLTETWIFECTYAPGHAAEPPSGPGWQTPLKNTATASGTYETTTVQDTADYTLYPWRIRKDVVLYWDGTIVQNNVADTTVFTVEVFEKQPDSSYLKVGEFTVSEPNAQSVKLWLSAGTYRFCEKGVPTSDVAQGDEEYIAAYCLGATPGAGYPDESFFNITPFDLAVEKGGPVFVGEGGSVTYTYEVTNTGAPVAPVLTDDKCPGPFVKVGGDTNGDGFVQEGEKWKLTCTTTLNFHTAFPGCVLNTAHVYEQRSYENPGIEDGFHVGGDYDTTNNVDTYKLCTYEIFKFVYEYGTGADIADPTAFTVVVKQGSTVVGTVTIKEGDSARFWLAPGTYTFCETVAGPYIPNFKCWTSTVPGDYPAWSVVNHRWNGCSHGFWKTHPASWPTGYLPAHLVGAYFTGSYYGSDTLAKALAYEGGSGVKGGERILLRQAVAALLNEASYGPSFGPYASVADLKADVSAALASDDRDRMLRLAERLDWWNNGYCG